MTKFGKLLLTAAVIVGVIVLIFVIQKEPAPVDVVTETPTETPTEIPAEENPATEILDNKNNKDDLISFSIPPGQTVSGVMDIEGTIKNAYFFEANILINVLDKEQNLLKAGYAMATTDWMTTEPVEFAGSIDFTGLPVGAAYIQIHNDNPSDMRELDKYILIPVIIE